MMYGGGRRVRRVLKAGMGWEGEMSDAGRSGIWAKSARGQGGGGIMKPRDIRRISEKTMRGSVEVHGMMHRYQNLIDRMGCHLRKSPRTYSLPSLVPIPFWACFPCEHCMINKLIDSNPVSLGSNYLTIGRSSVRYD